MVKCLSVFDIFVGLALKGLSFFCSSKNLEPSQTYKMALLDKNSWWLKAVKYFHKNHQLISSPRNTLWEHVVKWVNV